jgi:hypothetical protein
LADFDKDLQAQLNSYADDDTNVKKQEQDIALQGGVTDEQLKELLDQIKS